MKVAKFAIRPAMLVQSVKTGWRVVATGLPPDAAYRWAWYDHEREIFWVVCASESFAEVPEGGTIPEMESPVIRTVEDTCPHS